MDLNTLNAVTPDARDTQIRKAAVDFEATYLGMTFDAMLEEAMPNPTGGFGEEMFRSVMSDALAQEVAGAGGVGIASMVEAQMRETDK